MHNPKYLFVLLALASMVATASSIFTTTATITRKPTILGNEAMPSNLVAVTKALTLGPKHPYNDLPKHLGSPFPVDTTGYASNTTIPASNSTANCKINTGEFRFVVLQTSYIIHPSHPYLHKHLGYLFVHNAPSTFETITTIVKIAPEETFSTLPIDPIYHQPASTSTTKYTSFSSSSTISPLVPTGPILLIPTLNGLLLPAQGSYSNSASPILPRGEAMDLQAQAWAATQAAATGQAASSSFWKAIRCWAMLALIPRPFQAIPMLTPWCKHALSHESKYAENSAIHNNGTVVVTKTVTEVQSTVSMPIATGTSISNTTQVNSSNITVKYPNNTTESFINTTQAKFSNITVKNPNTTTLNFLNTTKVNFSNNTVVKFSNMTEVDFSNTTKVASGRQPSESNRITLTTIRDSHLKHQHHKLIHASNTPSLSMSTATSSPKLSTQLIFPIPSSSASTELLAPRSPLLHECPEGPYCHNLAKHPFRWFNDQVAKFSKADWGIEDRISIGEDNKAFKMKTYETNKRPEKPKGYKGEKKGDGKDNK